MSFHFDIKKNKRVTFNSIFSQLKTDNVKIAFPEELNLDEELSNYQKFYIPNISSRGISISVEDSSFDIGINVLASGEDYLLACDLASTIARITDSEIEPESEEEPISIEDFNKEFNASWAEANKTMGLSAINHLVKEKNDTISIGGCLRDYYIGTDLLDGFQKGEPEEIELYNRIINSIRDVQFLKEGVRVTNRFVVTEKDDSKWEYIVITPEQEQLLLKTEFVVLNISKEEFHKVPYEEIEEYAKLNFKRLDEGQYLFPNMSQEEFYKFMENFGFQRTIKKSKWWEFWN